MLASIRHSLCATLTDAVRSLAPEAPFSVQLERPRDASHGDAACNIAMVLAKPLGKNPRALAQEIVTHALGEANPLIAGLEIAGPGFINIRLTQAAHTTVLTEIASSPDAFGSAPAHTRGRVMLEFVSANPTGPLHVGHARQAALGDILGNILSARGAQVHREFYYNDAGAQIQNLAISVQARARGMSVDDEAFPADGYRGEYIMDIANAYTAGETVNGETSTGDVEDLEAVRRFAVAYLRREQDMDLQAFGLQFDHYFLESSLYSSGAVEATVARLTERGHTYEADGALWLRSTDFGDDKDRVMRKAEGGYTYFVPDVAYHINKFERGFTQVINIQGTDHHGTIARVRAGLQAADCGIPAGYPDYILHKMVMVMKDGAEVKLSKRAGSYVTLRDLVDWTGAEATRFFLISRKADTEFVFDVDAAVKQSDENPVYYVQYAHARICSILAKADSEAIPSPTIDPSLLTLPAEIALMQQLSQFPDTLEAAANDLAPHHVVFYLRELASCVHSYCGGSERILHDDLLLRSTRLYLLLNTRAVLHNGLKLLGIQAKVQM